MNQEDKFKNQSDLGQKNGDLTTQTSSVDGQDSLETEELPVSFLDRAIAALILMLPFSKLIEWSQDKLHDHLPQSIANISVLVGIILFLVATGRLSKTIYHYRLKFIAK